MNFSYYVNISIPWSSQYANFLDNYFVVQIELKLDKSMQPKLQTHLIKLSEI